MCHAFIFSEPGVTSTYYYCRQRRHITIYVPPRGDALCVALFKMRVGSIPAGVMSRTQTRSTRDLILNGIMSPRSCETAPNILDVLKRVHGAVPCDAHRGGGFLTLVIAGKK